ncbi:MAG: methyltransferase domain-containing protein [Proteobacteria bacterium]|nr:methyltransferase domain-containing protein [Pseudomonadota bacterium]MBU1738384.1 methyltransferase domain-containing protein [Pseudomonadota bacterium]
MSYIDFMTTEHTRTKRDYLERVRHGDKAERAAIAKRFDYEYWDGDRRNGYGGFHYDGRWEPMARRLIDHYGLQDGQRVLDVGCGKGFLLYELKRILPGLVVRGLDISPYALENAKEEIRPFLDLGHARQLPYQDQSFDFILSLTTLHNLYLFDLMAALRELERVKSGNSYLVVESYRNEEEKANLLHWQLTCEAFFTPEEWEYIFAETGYSGDYSFIFFE